MRTRLARRHRPRHRSRHSSWRVVAGLALVVVVLAVVVLAVDGPAGAFWAAYGPGEGSAGTGSSAAVVVSPATPAAQLYPGGSADVVLTFTNPSPASVHLGSVALDATRGAGGFATDPAHAGCSPASLTFTTATNAGAGWTVPGAVAGTDGTLPVTLPAALSMGDAEDACQGAVFTVFLTAGP